MFGRTKYAVSFVSAAALTGTLLTGAFASHQGAWHSLVQAASKTTTFGGKVVVNQTLNVKKNTSVYGRLYAHDGLQVLNGGEIVKKGTLTAQEGIKTDTLEATGAISGGAATISGNLTAGGLATTGQLSGGTLTVSGAGTVGGALTAASVSAGTGAITGGSLTTTGDISGQNITAHGSLSTSGSFSATAGQFQNLTASGTVNFSNASVVGLNIGNLSSISLGTPSATTAPLNLSENLHTVQIGVDNTGALTLPSLTAGVGNFQALVLGSSTGNVAPLIVSENGKSVSLGVDSNGNLTVPNLNVSGTATLNSLVLGGTNSSLTTSVITAPNVTNTTNAGPLTLTGNGITLVGSTTVNGPEAVNGALTLGNDLALSYNATATTNNPVFATHITAGGDTDVAGQTTVGITTATAEVDRTVCFTRAYATQPIVTLTPASNPNSAQGMPSWWVTAPSGSTATNCPGANQGFTVHVTPPTGLVNGYNLTFNYHVIGS